MTDLLTTDRLARQFGVALNPRLRDAMEADLRFPARAASPRPEREQTQGSLPQNVVRLLPSGEELTRSAG
ncbi:hypothetical protein [Ruegeria hyattellae]|uniref:hypothetical protein n=1 Tax=Ruegeria hyattellae TaxID=3233337 RepID=UPI00355C6FF1